LVPVMETLVQLAQENMMLAGTLSSSVGVRGEASGVMALVARGMTVEAVPEPEPEPAPEAEEMAEAAPADEDYSVAEEVATRIETVWLPVRFEFNSADLSEDGIREAEALVAFLQSAEPGGFTLEGHTDEVGDAGYNMQLSLQRAETVRGYLRDRGITAPIEVVGRGESEPPVLSAAAVYTDEQRRAIARRVELVLPDAGE